MSKQQLHLAGSKKARTKVDDKALEKFLRGETDLTSALGLSPEAIKDLRRQAVALHGAGKWREAVDLVTGIVALGSVHPVDAQILARAYAELGETEASMLAAAHYEDMMAALGRPAAHSAKGAS